MKNTLIVKREFISDEVIEVIKKSHPGFVNIEIIDNSHSYIINFNPDKTEIDIYKKRLFDLVESLNVKLSDVDTVIEGVIFSSIATLYSKVFTALMQEVVKEYVKNNVEKVTYQEIGELIKKLT